MTMDDWRDQLASCREIARLAERAGDLDRAVRAMRRAADLLRAPEGEPDPAREVAHGDVCGRLGEMLWEERLPEAIQAYQEAADAYGRSFEMERRVACARRVVEGVRLLRSRPAERLDLLIARYDADLRKLAESPGSVREQAALQFKVATVLQRRDRFAGAAERYGQSLRLYVDIEDAKLEEAQCHHRLADLYHHELRDDSLARQHYQQAIQLYRMYEPVSEGEQMNRVLCQWHLDEIDQRTPRR